MQTDMKTMELFLMIMGIVNGIWLFVIGRMHKEIHMLRNELSDLKDRLIFTGHATHEGS